MNQNASFEERFWKRVSKTPTCWNWTGKSDKKEYGRITHRGLQTNAHRVSWILLRGEIPEGLTLDHLCQNKRCVNPDHLEPVTRGENARRYMLGRTHCKNGHEFNPINTRIAKKDGRRQCRICHRFWQKNFETKMKTELLLAARLADKGTEGKL